VSSSKDLFFEPASNDLAGGLDDGEAAAIALAVSKETLPLSLLTIGKPEIF
jgi:hypothetical protein